MTLPALAAAALLAVWDVLLRAVLFLARATLNRMQRRLAAATLLAAAPLHAAELNVGDKAPAFDLASTAGGRYQLGGRTVVLAWFPRAHTPGCTMQCKSLAKHGDLIRVFDVDYFMVSTDPLEDNAGFAAKYDADFPMLSDPTAETAKAYGVYHERGFAMRDTFYIGPDRTILAIDRKSNPATAAEDIAATLAELNVPRRLVDAAEAEKSGGADASSDADASASADANAQEASGE